MANNNFIKTNNMNWIKILFILCVSLMFFDHIENLNALSLSPNTGYPPSNQFKPINPNNPNLAGPMIIDMMLASPDDDPEPYIIEYIQGKEKLQVKKIRVLGAPDTSTIFFTAYQTFSNQQCKNLWLVRVSISDNMAQGYARVMPCEQALRENILKIENKRTVLHYSSTVWPK